MNEEIMYLTVPDYAAKVGVTKQAVYLQIKQGKIQTKKIIENGKIIKCVAYNGETAILNNEESSPDKTSKAEVKQSNEQAKKSNEKTSPVKSSKEEVKQSNSSVDKPSKTHTEEYIAHLEAEIIALREQIQTAQDQNIKLTESLNATLQITTQAQQITTQAQILHKLAAAPEEEKTPPPVEAKPNLLKRIFSKKNKAVD